jgi:RHS repeat-associated protein
MRHTDASQVVQNTYEYDAWGTPYVATEGASTKQQYRMSQKELDPDAVAFNSQNSRYHFPARTYIPLRANFIQIDPLAIGNPGRNQGLYLYAMANPLIRIDPDGRFSALSIGQSVTAIPPGFGVGINIVDPSIHGWGLVNVRTVILTPFMVSPVLGAIPSFDHGSCKGMSCITGQPPGQQPPQQQCEYPRAVVFKGELNFPTDLINGNLFNVDSAVFTMQAKFIQRGYQTKVYWEAIKADFLTEINNDCVQVIAYVGHGGVNNTDPLLVFKASLGVTPWDLSWRTISKCLQYAFLGACESGTTGPLASANTGSGLRSFIQAFAPVTPVTYDYEVPAAVVAQDAVKQNVPAPRPNCP